MKIKILDYTVEIPDGLTGEALAQEIAHQKKLIQKKLILRTSNIFKGARWNDSDWDDCYLKEIAPPLPQGSDSQK